MNAISCSATPKLDPNLTSALRGEKRGTGHSCLFDWPSSLHRREWRRRLQQAWEELQRWRRGYEREQEQINEIIRRQGAPPPPPRTDEPTVWPGNGGGGGGGGDAFMTKEIETEAILSSWAILLEKNIRMIFVYHFSFPCSLYY
ncbi:hypothetical protein niasHT_007128 [Heterodera trifolii]|uniref:Uncharacterized protein n=1 Tax=Heterodera trifolii TaxID=157864 RepID=A0ABD2LL28_9BILA